MTDAYHLYTISFTVGSESGIALVAAVSDKDAFQILKNGGSRGSGYVLQQCRDIGMTSCCTYGLLMESFVNAKEAYDAIMQAANALVGPRGEKGDTGEVGPEGPRGKDGASLISVEQTVTSFESGGQNEITFSIEGGDTSKVYIKNGEAGVNLVNATVDSLPGTPRVVTNIDSERNLSFAFYGLKGVQGNPGVNNTSMQVVEELPTASADTMDIVFLVYNETSEEYDRYITQYDGEEYSFVQIGDTSLDLDDYKRIDSEVWLTQEEFDALSVKDITKTYYIYEESDDIDWEEPSSSSSEEEESET